jgi:hypothetical protein
MMKKRLPEPVLVGLKDSEAEAGIAVVISDSGGAVQADGGEQVISPIPMRAEHADRACGVDATAPPTKRVQPADQHRRRNSWRDAAPQWN